MLKNYSLKTKVLVFSLSIGIVASIILGIVIYSTSIVPIKKQEEQRIISQMTSYIYDQINQKIQAGILGSTSLSIEQSFVDALEVEERDDIIPVIKIIGQKFKNQTRYKNIETQVITADGRALVKSWDTKSYGQNLTNNPIIRKVIKEKQAYGSLAIGARGVSVITMSPVIHDGEFYGMIAMIQGLASVRKAFEKSHDGSWIMLVDKDYVKKRYGKMPVIDKNTSFTKKYILANNKWFTKDVVDFTKKAFKPVDGKHNAVYAAGKEMIIDIPALDETGNVFGRNLLIIDKAKYEAPINAAIASAQIALVGIILAILLLTISIIMVVSRLVINELMKKTGV